MVDIRVVRRDPAEDGRIVQNIAAAVQNQQLELAVDLARFRLTPKATSVIEKALSLARSERW